MKKALSILAVLCLLCALATGCSGTKKDFIDLTALSETLRSAELTNISSYPAQYEGKTIKLGGVYQAQLYGPGQEYWHYILVMDAAACCAQGLEFIWNGDHTYPDDYPQDGTPIVLTGVYESDEEMGYPRYRLAVDNLTLAE